MSVNMFGLRLTTDFHPRTKNGDPPQSTTGVARIISSHVHVGAEATWASGLPGRKSAIAARKTGRARAALIQNLRRMSRSSGFWISVAETVRGSSAMPQMGQEPGSGRTICGCIGQKYSVRADGGAGIAASSAMPHLGHRSEEH